MGSVYANTGGLLLGWDTDRFPTDVYLTTKIMLIFPKYGGFTTGGVNSTRDFVRAFRRRESDYSHGFLVPPPHRDFLWVSV